MVLQCGGWARGKQLFTIKNQPVLKCYTGPQICVDPCDCSNEPSGSIKGRELLDYLSNYLLLKEDSAPWSQLVGRSVSQSVIY
jgi:hypothetical protein